VCSFLSLASLTFLILSNITGSSSAGLFQKKKDQHIFLLSKSSAPARQMEQDEETTDQPTHFVKPLTGYFNCEKKIFH